MLVQISQQLQLHFPDAIVARFGGEEFCIQSCRNPQQFLLQLEQLRQSIEQLVITYQNASIRVTISIGTAGGTHHQLSELLKTADGYLYRAKHNGRNQIQVAPHS